MPRKSTIDKQKQADLLAKVPPSATRVQVITAKGDKKYRSLDPNDKNALALTDTIQTNKMGDPIVMKGKPGRKSTPTVGPVNPTVAELLKRRQTAMDDDPILTQIAASPDSANVLNEVIRGLGEESASLKFERQEAAREGKDTSGLSSKRVQALRAVGDTWLKRMDQLVAKSIDLDGPSFAIVFELMMDTLREAMNSANLRDEQIKTVFAKFSSMIDDDWKNEAKLRMKRNV